MAQLCIDIRLVFLPLCRGYWLFHVSHTKQHLSVAYHKDALGNTRGPGDNDDPELTRAFHSGAHAAAGVKALSRGGRPKKAGCSDPECPYHVHGKKRACTGSAPLPRGRSLSPRPPSTHVLASTRRVSSLSPYPRRASSPSPPPRVPTELSVIRRAAANRRWSGQSAARVAAACPSPLRFTTSPPASQPGSLHIRSSSSDGGGGGSSSSSSGGGGGGGISSRSSGRGSGGGSSSSSGRSSGGGGGTNPGAGSATRSGTSYKPVPSHSSLLHDIALLQEALIAAEKNASAAHATAGKQAELITKLKKELEEKDEQIEALKSQLKDYQMYILRHHKGSKQLAAQTHAFKRAIGARAAAKNSREVAGKQAKAAASSGGGGACTEVQPSQLALWEDGDGVPKLVNILHLNEDEANVTISVPSFDPGVANEERVVPKDQLTIDEDIVEEGVEDISKQRANFIVSEMTGVLYRPGVDHYHAQQILRAFTNSKVVSTTLQSILSSEERQPGLSGELQIMWRMMVRLREAVCDLKNSTSDLLLHHAYSTIMTALAPGSVDALPWELNAMTKSLGLSSKKGLNAGVKRKDAILSEGGGVWFDEEREERKDSFTKEMPADAHQVESFWYSNTAREAGRV